MRWISCFAAMWLMGCVEEVCGPHMHFARELGVCACDDDAITEAGGCRPCEDDEVVVDNACVAAPTACSGSCP